MTAVTDLLRDLALAALVAAQRWAHDDDDVGMFEASDEDLLGWADDLEARVGLDVSIFRSAIEAYVAARAHAAVVDKLAEACDTLSLSLHAILGDLEQVEPPPNNREKVTAVRMALTEHDVAVANVRGTAQGGGA